MSDEERLNMKLHNGVVGKRVINDGKRMIYVDPNDLAAFVGSGWKVGRLKK